MDFVNYLEEVKGLRSVDRTVLAQEVDPTEDGTLKYPIYFPITEVKTTKLGDISVGTFRPVATRREWNGPDRAIPVKTPNLRDIEMVPISSHFTMGEKELNDWEAISDGDEQIILKKMGAEVESRTDGLAEADYRRVEVDAFRVWATGKLVQTDPQTNNEVETDFKFGADRIQDASGDAWDSTDACPRLITWLKAGKPKVGGTIEGVMLSQSKYDLIRASGPKTGPTDALRPVTRAELEAYIAEEIGVAVFRFVINDDTVSIPAGGGLEYDEERVWDADYVSAIPAGGRVGITAKAPVVKAAQLKRAYPNANIDRNGVAVSYISLNEGMGLKVRAQVNMLSIPNKFKVWSIKVS